jgi:hypothetical protein
LCSAVVLRGLHSLEVPDLPERSHRLAAGLFGRLTAP